MKSSSEYRTRAWGALREGGLVAKFLCVAMALTFLMSAVDLCWQEAVKTLDIQTWGMFFQAKAKALLSGLDLVVPSRTIAMRMSAASAFETFVSAIANGILLFGLAGFALRAAKGDHVRWFTRSFAALAFPLDVAWLYFRLLLQIVLWTLLFVVPGIVAIYRYCQCWNLKVEHPDWPAGRCLAESGRLMRGHKWRRFCLDVSFWRQYLLLGLGMVALVLSGRLAVEFPLAGGVGMLLSVGCLWGGFVLGLYVSLAHAFFYLDLRAEIPSA